MYEWVYCLLPSLTYCYCSLLGLGIKKLSGIWKHYGFPSKHILLHPWQHMLKMFYLSSLLEG